MQRPERICQRTLDWGEDELPEWFNHEVIETDGGLDIIRGHRERVSVRSEAHLCPGGGEPRGGARPSAQRSVH